MNMPKPAESSRIRFSLDAGRPHEYDPMARSPVMGEHEHGLGASGLRRIRQQPLSRAPTMPTSPQSSFTPSTRSSSMTINMPHQRTFTPGGPSSPTLNFSEDLSRFPSESLHSFSFAHQSEDALHNRQNVLKKSIDFMRDRLGWAANNPGIINAQAKVSGDLEVQSMMELLARAKVLGNGSGLSHGSNLLGPLTGPADIDGTNVFEKTFLSRSESPEQMKDQTSFPREESSDAKVSGPTLNVEKDEKNHAMQDRQSEFMSIIVPTAEPKVKKTSLPRPGLKRTYTDLSPLSLQNKLLEALAKPYLARAGATEDHLLSPNIMPSFGKSLNATGSDIPPSVHGHPQRWAPAAQAIFTTESQSPYTILAANDLACLVFGVTKAEIRKLGILEVVREDRREWLEEKLKLPGSEATGKARSPTGKSQQANSNASTSVMSRGGITAMLLSKPSSRQSASRKAQTDDGSGSSYAKNRATPNPHHLNHKSRGVLLCGDVVPILKRNGVTGSASLWVKEKRGALIWVLEEIVEDMVYLTLDETGKILDATGATDAIWGENVRPDRVEIRRLFPHLPILDGQVNYARISQLQHFTARHADSYNIPTTITTTPSLGELRISSFPHIAGIIVLSATDLTITSSNAVFSAALFGQPQPDGLAITKLIPRFDSILNTLEEEDQVRLVDGIVIPEHSFRRARAMLALREGSSDAAAIFLRPTGLIAKHRDGSNIHVDVSMRVVKSESQVLEEVVIEEASDSDSNNTGPVLSPNSQVVYALWITYSRHLHSTTHPNGPTSPLISRPGTPPHQPSPGQAINIIVSRLDTEDPRPLTPNTLISQQIEEATLEPISGKPHAQPSQDIKMNPPAIREPPEKKTINDFVILEDMGQGAYGQVKLGRYRKHPSDKVVLKYVTKKRILLDTWIRGN